MCMNEILYIYLIYLFDNVWVIVRYWISCKEDIKDIDINEVVFIYIEVKIEGYIYKWIINVN